MTPDREIEPLPDDLMWACARILTSAGWQPVDGHPSLFVRSNAGLLSALRCTFSGAAVTVASVSMTFEEDRPLQITVQPRGPAQFPSVCAVLARHAPRLDRLDYAGCVADLLAYAPEVRLECETSGLVPMAARMVSGGVRTQAAPPAPWPPLEAARKALNQRRRAGEAGLLPWEPAQHKQLPRLLAKDRAGSLSARRALYEEKGLLRPGDGFVRNIEAGRHTVWFPGDDSKGAFAYSIGLAYLHDLPEILLLAPTPAMIGATSRALALTVNALADAMIGGVRLTPGDRYAAVADVVARTVHRECTLDHAGLGESRFVIPPARIQERTLGFAEWFYANFMDTPSFPLLACLLQPPRVPDGYGLPPPPPPAKKRRAAKPEAGKPVKAKRAAPEPRPRTRRAKEPAAKPATRQRPRRGVATKKKGGKRRR